MMSNFADTLAILLNWIILALFVFSLFGVVLDKVKNSSRKRMLKKIKPGDMVITTTGKEGKVLGIYEDHLDLKIKGHKASYIKEAIKAVVKDNE